MDRQDRQDIFYWIRKVLTVNNRYTEDQNPVYPVYPCLNPYPWRGPDGKGGGKAAAFYPPAPARRGRRTSSSAPAVITANPA